jgi:hypothetical protein
VPDPRRDRARVDSPCQHLPLLVAEERALARPLISPAGLSCLPPVNFELVAEAYDTLAASVSGFGFGFCIEFYLQMRTGTLPGGTSPAMTVERTGLAGNPA